MLQENKTSEKKVDRRRFLKYVAGAGVVAAAAAGAYYAVTPSAPPSVATETLTSTATPGETLLEVWDCTSFPTYAVARARMATEYMKNNPNTKIVQTMPGWDVFTPQLMAAKQTDTLPHIVEGEVAHMAFFNKAGFTLPVTDIVDKIGRDKFSERDLYYQTYKGEIIAIPNFMFPYILFYWKDLLETAGWTKPPETWEQWLQCCKDTTKAGVKGTELFAAEASGFNLYVLMATNDAHLLNEKGELAFNSRNTHECLYFLKDLKDANVLLEASSTQKVKPARSLFVSKKCAMVAISCSISGMIVDAKVQDQIGSVRVPPNKSSLTLYNPTALMLGNQKRNLEAAKKYLLWQYDDTVFMNFATQFGITYPPLFKPVVNSKEYWEHPNIAPYAHLTRPIVDIVNKEEVYFPGMEPGVNEYPGLFETQGLLRDCIQNVLVNNVTPEEACEKAESEMAKIMKG